MQKMLKLMLMLLIFHFLRATNQICIKRQDELLLVIRGNYKNVLQLNGGAIISTKLENGFGFEGGNMEAALMGHFTNFYIIRGTFQENQLYELNTLKIRFFDNDGRIYSVNIFLLNEKQETLIYDGNAQSIFILKFPDQLVNGVRILNVSGSTLKAFYTLSKQ
ncbi:unnamed protein product [Paramecium octaurelia]|uniref:Uncharacterized protein n=1 Tax=Paramecium octaurelia TaxID=43137 RepID=A0A8S1XXV6_PAROT|nr:unnamed protein product [Paramecium octaurelia]